MKRLFCLLLLASATARAQTLSINWFTIDCGGTTSTGGVYSVAGTPGQPDSGSATGGLFSAAGGFWLVETGEEQEATLLVKLLSPGAAILFSWPNTLAGYKLQQAPGLLPPAAWTDVVQSPASTAGQYQVSIPIDAQAKFYRLRRP